MDTRICVINLKGGVGKSVTTINLADCFARRGRRVLVIDLDKQANTTKYYNMLDYTASDVGDVLTGKVEAAKALRSTGEQDIMLLPANMSLLNANREIMLDTLHPQQCRLRDALDSIDGVFDVVLMDCPPDLDMGAINALCAADWVLVPVDCDEWAADGLSIVMEQIESIRTYYNHGLKILGVLITKYRPTNYARRIISDIARTCPVMQTGIRFTVKVAEATASHQPLYLFARGSTAAQDYDALCDEIIERVHDGHREGN